MNVSITGMSGFLGSSLARALEAQGHKAIRCPIRIGEPVDAAVFEDAEVVVHCAWDFRPGTFERNVTGARLIFDAAKGRRRIFISSHSARADAASEYGASKYAAERLLLDRGLDAGLEAGDTVVRPGLVIGMGGTFAGHLRTIRTSPIIPLIDGGRDKVAVLALADFSRAMVQLIEARVTDSGRPSAYNLFSETNPTMREIVDTVLRLERRRAWIMPVPYSCAFAAVSVAARVGIPLPLNPGSIRTLKLNRKSVHQSNLRELLATETTLEEALRNILGLQNLFDRK